MSRARLKQIAQALGKILRTWKLLLGLALVAFFLFFVQGLVGYLGEIKEPWGQAVVQIGTLFVGALSGSILATVFEDIKNKRDLDALTEQLEEAFKNKQKETFDAKVNEFIKRRAEHPAVVPNISEVDIARRYFDWMELIALEQDWNNAYQQFSEIEKTVCDHEPLDALMHFEARLGEAKGGERIFHCLRELSPSASLKLLQYHFAKIQLAIQTNSQLERQFEEFANRPNLTSKEGNELSTYVNRFILKRELPTPTIQAPNDFYAKAKINHQRMKDVLNGTTEEESDHSINGKYAVPLLQPLFALEDIAVTGKKGEGKTFAKERFKADCETRANTFYFEWQSWQDYYREEKIPSDRVRASFYADLHAACKGHDTLKDAVANEGADIEHYKEAFRQNGIETVFLVMDLGNAEDDTYFKNDNQRANVFFQSLPRRQISRGNPRFHLRLFVEDVLLSNTEGSRPPIKTVLPLNWYHQVLTNEHPKIELVKRRLQFIQIRDNPGLNQDLDLFEQGVIEQIANSFTTPREIIEFLRILLEHQATKYTQNPDDALLFISMRDCKEALAK